MKNYGYVSWEFMVNEHIVRAVSTRMASGEGGEAAGRVSTVPVAVTITGRNPRTIGPGSAFRWFTGDEIRQMVKDKVVTDGFTLTALLLWLQR